MKSKKVLWSILTVIMLLSMTVGAVLAEVIPVDDGVMFRKNVSKTPDQETERANINHMAFYVPAQTASGELTTIEYFAADNETDVANFTRDYAKPLVSVYIDSLPEEEVKSGAGFGAHDAYAAHSLDDGATWKSTNLSLSADLSSFTLENGEPYPGDAHNMTFAIAGDKVLVGWISKYCDGGSPLYTLADEDVLALQTEFGLPDLYVRDIWGVAGAQQSVDYELQGFPEVGEIPYSCVWSARGQLLPTELADGSTGYDIIWTKAERLTSGRRDANRLEMNGDSAAGFMMTWQEDPEGLRPGMGLGPGEGWSGAVVNQQTDLWYSFISIEEFNKVDTDGDLATIDPILLDEYAATYPDGTMPKPAVPMAMPIRLTDNAMCKDGGGTSEDSLGTSLPYCFINFDDENPFLTDLPDDLPTTFSSDSTFCATQQPWETPSGITQLTLCQAEDGRVLGGRVGASRPRVNVQPFDSDGDATYDNAYVIMGAEESKALGEGSVDDTAEPEDIGKNMWYYSFDMLNPEFVLQGGMLNWPAKDPLNDGADFPMLLDDFGNEFYETEIARRFSHFSQPIHQIGESGVSAVLIVKQGILNQGGPADIFLRLIKAPESLFTDVSSSIQIEPFEGESPVLPEVNLISADETYDIYGFVWQDLDGDEHIDLEFEIIDADLDGIPDNTEDVDGDGRLDLYNEDIDLDGHLDVNEDINENGILDLTEDINGNGELDLINEDLDGDWNLDVEEVDTNENGILDPEEDIDGDGKFDLVDEDIDNDGYLDTYEDLNYDGNLDVFEDENGNGILDPDEDEDGDSVLDLVEDLDSDGHLDVAEDKDGDGNLDVFEDLDGDRYLDIPGDLDGDDGITYEGIADVTLHLHQDLNGDGVVQLPVDLDGDNDFLEEVDENGDGILDPDEDIDDDDVLDQVDWGEYSALATSNDQGFYIFPEVPRGIDYTISVVDDEYQAVVGPAPISVPIVENPYAYENMVCDEWAYTDGSNPRYLEGLCLSTGINVSGTTIDECSLSSPEECVAAFPYDSYQEQITEGFPKVTWWSQTEYNLDDESWENPFDVAKGHRGFIDGDFIMMMYAWSPNWQANSVGNDHYNLYARRSFDGGLTWTTTPASLGGTGVTGDEVTNPTACEHYKQTDGTIETDCFTYGPGEFEQARNLSQLIGNKETILDPRYTPTGGLKMLPVTDYLGVTGGLIYPEDEVRDPSKYFIVYETGDNTTVAEGEAVPLDLFYSRATVWGDEYELAEYIGSDGVGTFGFDWLEKDREDLSGEAANTANNAGTMYYAIWNQWQEDEYENVSESDAIFRRTMFLDEEDKAATNYAPLASIFASDQEVFGVEEDQVITLYATAREIDTMNDEILEPIQEYVWTINGVAIPVEYQDEFKEMGLDCFSGKVCNAPARIVSGYWDGSQFMEPGWADQNNYQYGFYEFALQVRDNDDPAKWSKVVKIKKYIGETQFDLPGFKIFLPLTTK